MAHILKLKHCRYFLRKIYGDTFKWKYSMYGSKSIGIQSMQLIDFSCIPVTYSFHQIREYAKRAQGKVPKSSKVKRMELTDEEMAEVIDIDDYRQKLNNVVEKLKQEYVDNLTIHSATANIDSIIVNIDGQDYPLNELAVISKKNPNLIAINMSDFPEALKPAIQAIINSGSGFNPQQEGTMIYLNIPKMTREHRETLAKNARTLFIKAKDDIRSIQNSFIKDAKDKTHLSEDLIFSATNQIKLMADHCAADIEKILKFKQKELLGDS